MRLRPIHLHPKIAKEINRSLDSLRSSPLAEFQFIVPNRGVEIGRPGDLLWLREKWAARDFDGEWPTIARQRRYVIVESGGGSPRDPHNWHSFNAWQPAKDMPIWAARHILRIKDIKPVCMGEIDDFELMGVYPRDHGFVTKYHTNGVHATPELAFKAYWTSILNRRWGDKKPVWVVRVTKFSFQIDSDLTPRGHDETTDAMLSQLGGWLSDRQQYAGDWVALVGTKCDPVDQDNQLDELRARVGTDAFYVRAVGALETMATDFEIV